MNREKVVRDLIEKKIIVILRGFGGETLKKTVSAMVEGGIRFVEITFDQSGRTSDEEIAADIRMLCEAFGEDLHVGAGTVLTEEQTIIAADAGAQYIVSPDSYEPVIRKTRELGLVSIPGAFTPTEAANAHRWGADFIKLFPNAEVKPSYIRTVSLPLSHIRFLAVGGVTSENMQEYLKNGATGLGVATAIADKKLIDAGDFQGITEKALRFTKLL